MRKHAKVNYIILNIYFVSILLDEQNWIYIYGNICVVYIMCLLCGL